MAITMLLITFYVLHSTSEKPKCLLETKERKKVSKQIIDLKLLEAEGSKILRVESPLSLEKSHSISAVILVPELPLMNHDMGYLFTASFRPHSR